MNRTPFFLRTSFAAMGSPCEVQLFARSQDEAAAAAAAVEADVRRLEAKYSRYRPDSLLGTINALGRTGGRLEIDAETAALLDYAAACHRQSGGLFDITSGVLRRVWRKDRTDLPSSDEIAESLRFVGWERVGWRGTCLDLPEGCELDFGGIVKEFAADRAGSLLRERGVAHAVVNLGGDIRIVGPQADGADWRIGIQHPRRRDMSLGTLNLHAGGVATSGDYERCIVVEGERYGHVLNPVTGWPVRHLASVTVIADVCVVAGSVSTIAMLKEAEGPGWLESLGVPHLWVGTDGRIGGSLHGGTG